MVGIASASEADIEACVELLTILFTQEAEFTAAPDKQRAGLRLILSHPDVGRLYCAWTGGAIVGMATLLLSVSTALGARDACLEDVVVAPAHRNQGIGSQLIAYAMAEAERLGCARISLLTDADNYGAQQLYARFGFQPSPMVPYRHLFQNRTRIPEIEWD